MPLVSGVVHQPLRHRVTVRDETLQHHGEVDVSDTPLAEEIVGAVLEQGEGRRDESVAGLASALR
jgi:hypothetical protein